MASKNILITGGLGYVGGRIATHLISVSPDTSMKIMTRPDREQIPPWAADAVLVKADLQDPAALRAALAGVDTVVHLAAVNEMVSQNDPELAVEVNGQGTYQLLEACREVGVGRFIYFSTFHVYGPGVTRPITELCPTRPIHPYAITHRLAEDYVNWYRHSHGLETAILRLSNGYGYPADGQVDRWTLVFNDLAMQAVQEGEIRLRSGGGQHRDFVSLTDVSRGVQHFLDLPTGAWGDGLFNFGGNCSMSILDVAKRVSAEYLGHTGREVPVILGGPDDSSSHSPVEFSMGKLTRTGFELSDKMSEEILGTFQLCDHIGASANAGQ